ncbi:MAG TPA: WXG100 family type VII secretion target [Pyrinomonadaceae bacterium]|nr:WXG100 family type VII secretion target [Pyrinomonadaceae bacterium]
MAQMHADPERMRRFAGDLKKFADAVSGEMSNIRGRLGRLGDTWQDQQYEAFVEIFARAEGVLKGFVEETRRAAPLIERDADAAEETGRVSLPQ